MKIVAVTLALITVVYAVDKNPLAREGSLARRSLATRDDSDNKDHKHKDNKKHKGKKSKDEDTNDPKNLKHQGYVDVKLCKNANFNDCFEKTTPMLKCFDLDHTNPEYTGKISSLWVEDGGLCWFYKDSDCRVDDESFGIMGGNVENLKKIDFGDGVEQDFDDYFLSYYCQEGQP